MKRRHSPARPWLPLPRPTPVQDCPCVCDVLETATWRRVLRPSWGACRRGAERGLPEETYRGHVDQVTRELAEKELEAETDWGNACER